MNKLTGTTSGDLQEQKRYDLLLQLDHLEDEIEKRIVDLEKLKNQQQMWTQLARTEPNRQPESDENIEKIKNEINRLKQQLAKVVNSKHNLHSKHNTHYNSFTNYGFLILLGYVLNSPSGFVRVCEIIQ